MDIMYLFDNNYAYIAGISMLSLMDNNQDADGITFYCVVDNVNEENMEKLRLLVNGFNREIVFIPKPDLKPLLGESIELHWWIENVFSRVFLQEVLKDYPELNKILYIDCDTLILGDLKELWDINLDGYIGAGVCEAMGDLHKKAIGLEPSDNYFNAGMFLIDLNKWRTDCIDEKASSFVKKHGGKLEYADESVLNGVLSSQLLRLNPKFNITSLSVYFCEKDLKKYRKSYYTHTDEERNEALNDPRIVHFTSTYLDNRPWVENCNHPYRDKWDEYKAKSPWKDTGLAKDKRSKMKKIARTIALKMPKALRVELTGFVHAYIKPQPYL